MKTLIVSLVLLTVTTVAEAQIAYRSRSTATKTQITTFQTALRMFKDDCGRYPAAAEGLQSLLICPTNISTSKWHGPYIDGNVIPLDPWGHEYVYRYPGIHNTNGFDIYSCGADGISKSGGADANDINNWDPSSPHDAWEAQTLPAWLIGWTVFLLLQVGVAWWNWRTSKRNGNLHGVIALFWVSGMITGIIAMALVFPVLPELFAVPLVILLLVSLCGAGWLAVSGLRRGCLLSKTFGSIAILLLFAPLWFVLMPRFSN